MIIFLSSINLCFFHKNLQTSRLCSTSPTCRVDEPKRDIAFSIGTPLFGFSFAIGRFLKLKPLTLNCGINSLNHVLNKYVHLKNLNELQDALDNIDNDGLHPLLQLQSYQLPDALSHRLDLFSLR